MLKKSLVVSLMGMGLALSLNAYALNGTYGCGTMMYAGVQGGFNHLADVSDTLRPSNLRFSRSSDDGYNLGAVIGYKMPRLRFEGEYSFLKNDADKLSLGTDDGISVRGNARTQLLMANSYYDFECLSSVIVPYAGIGIGWAHTRENTSADIAAAPASYKGTDNAFAYQGILGAGFRLSQNAMFSLDYRYLRTTGTKFVAAADTLATTETVKDSAYRYSMIVGNISFRFA